MAVIYCGELNKIAYYIKEADLNIYSIQELAYFIYNFPMLISNNFINKQLILYIKKYLKNNVLYASLNEMYNSKENSIIDELLLILKSSNIYQEKELNSFIEYVKYLTKLDENKYIKICADSLFKLRKYYKAIKQYERIIDLEDSYKNIGYCYAKLLVFDKAIYYLEQAYERNNDINILRDLYFCLKIVHQEELFDKYKPKVSDDLIVEWECQIIELKLKAKSSPKLLEIDDIFLMGENYIKENIKLLIDDTKEKYRFIG